MRFVLHPKVYADIEDMMAYSSGLRRRGLPMNSMLCFGITRTKLRKDRNPRRFANAISAACTCSVFLIISYFVSSVMSSGFS